MKGDSVSIAMFTAVMRFHIIKNMNKTFFIVHLINNGLRYDNASRRPSRFVLIAVHVPVRTQPDLLI